MITIAQLKRIVKEVKYDIGLMKYTFRIMKVAK